MPILPRDREARAKLAALERCQAVIEFTLDGTILRANQNFLDAMGYELAEIKGRHHGLFVHPDYRESREYEEFWDCLRRGKPHAGEFRRLAKGGREVWIQAIYAPVRSLTGKLVKVVKFASDITRQKQIEAERRADQTSREARAARLSGLVRGFEDRAAGLVGIVASAATELQATAGGMSATAEQTTVQAGQVAASARQTAAGVQTVAAAAEELSTSVGEITRQVAQSAQRAGQAAEDARRTDAVVRKLSDGAQRIGDVVGLISTIAGQTNLLALNATIEAARAG